MKNQSLTRNFASHALGIPTRRVGIPDFVVKNEDGRLASSAKIDRVNVFRGGYV